MKFHIELIRPQEFGPLEDGSFTYTSIHHRLEEVRHRNEPDDASALKRFNQKRIMDRLESTIRAMALLDCGGGINVEIGPGESGERIFKVYVGLRVATDESRITAEESAAELHDLAVQLSNGHPKAEFRMRLVVHTTYSDIRLTASPNWRSTAPKVHQI